MLSVVIQPRQPTVVVVVDIVTFAGNTESKAIDMERASAQCVAFRMPKQVVMY